MIQRFLPQCPHEPLDVRRRVGGSEWNRQSPNPYDFVQPSVEVAAVGALSRILLYGDPSSELPKDPIVVVNQESR